MAANQTIRHPMKIPMAARARAGRRALALHPAWPEWEALRASVLVVWQAPRRPVVLVEQPAAAGNQAKEDPGARAVSVAPAVKPVWVECPIRVAPGARQAPEVVHHLIVWSVRESPAKF